MILQRARACRRDGEGRVGVARDGSAACGLARKQLVFQWRDTGLAGGGEAKVFAVRGVYCSVGSVE